MQLERKDCLKTEKIAILGAGLMGVGIAARFASADYRTLLYDTSEDRLREAPGEICGILDELWEAGRFDRALTGKVLERIETTSDLKALDDVDLAIEAIPEQLAEKQSLYAALLPIFRGHAIVASNTSSFLPDALTAKFERKDCARFLVTHFWNPPHWIPLVEIVPGAGTDPKNVERVRRMIADIGCEPVVLTKAIPGFIGNRLQFAVLREALHILQSGAASPEVVDTVMKMSLGQRYGVIGPFEGADIGGLNTFLDIATHLMPQLCTGEDGLDAIRDHIRRGETGLRRGQGFYKWSTERKQLLRAKRLHQLRTRFKE